MGKRSMNTWDIEKRFDDILINELWPKLNIEIVCKYITKEDQETKGDYRIAWKDKEFNVDNKAEYNVPTNFPIELIQDVPSQNMGWFYPPKLEKCNRIHYGVFNGDWSIRYIYSIYLDRLREYDFSVGQPRYNNGKDRFGVTVFWTVPLAYLIDIKIAKKLHEDSSSSLW